MTRVCLRRWIPRPRPFHCPPIGPQVLHRRRNRQLRRQSPRSPTPRCPTRSLRVLSRSPRGRTLVPPMRDPSRLHRNHPRIMFPNCMFWHNGLPSQGIWTRVPTHDAIVPGEPLVALPTYRPQLLLANGLRWTAVGPAQWLHVDGPDDPIPTVSLDFGRFIAVSSPTEGARVNVRIGARHAVGLGRS